MKKLNMLFAATVAGLLAFVANANEATAKAVRSEDGRILTFVYDALDVYGTKGENWFSVYEAETNAPLNIAPWKGSCHGSVTTVVFDKSFAAYRPKKCDNWFYQFSQLSNIMGIENLDVSEATNLQNMFEQCSSLQMLDLTEFDTRNVTTMAAMFEGCSSLKTIYASEKFSTDNLTFPRTSIFKDCTSLVGGGGIQYSRDFDGAQAACIGTDARGGYFKQKQAEVCRVGDKLTFYYDGEVRSADTSWSLDEELASWREYSATIKTVEFAKSFATYRSKTCKEWFKNFSQLKCIDGLQYLNVTKAESLQSMFEGCSALKELDLSGFDTLNVSSYYRMFKNCSALTTIYASPAFRKSDVKSTTGAEIFVGCSSLKGGKGTLWTADNTGFARAKIDKPTDKGYFTSTPCAVFVRNQQELVFYCDGEDHTEQGVVYSLVEDQRDDSRIAARWVQDVENIKYIVKTVRFDTSFGNYKAKKCEGWFANFTKLTKVDGLGNINLADGARLDSMFKGCTALASVDFEYLNFYNVTSLNSIFKNCTLLKQVKFPNRNAMATPNVTDMESMFHSCSALKVLDLSGFSTPKLTTAKNMFALCSALETVYTSAKFAVPQDGSDMFIDCTSLVGGYGTTHRGSSSTYAHIDAVGNPGYFTAFPQAFYNRANGKLTFYCDGIYSDHDGFAYEVLDAEAADLEEAPWQGVSGDITEVVFDASFANHRAKNCIGWFLGMHNLGRITGIENLDVSEAKSLSFLFGECAKLTELNLAGFNTANVTDMEGMFCGCSNLVKICVSSSFVTPQVTSSTDIFDGCKSLVGGRGTRCADYPYYGGIAYARIDAVGTPGFFTSNVPVLMITVVFDANGGTVSETNRLVMQGEKVGPLPVPVLRGCKFLGWYTKGCIDEGDLVTETTRVMDGVVYFAHWEDDAVLFDDINGGGLNEKGSTYNGFLSGDALEGTFTLDIGKPKKGSRLATAKMTLTNASTGKKIKKTGSVNLDDGTCTGDLEGLIVGAKGVGGSLDGLEAQGAIDAVKAKVSDSLAVFRNFDKKTFGLALTDSGRRIAVLTVTFATKGKAKVAGNYRDTKISGNAQLSVGDDFCLLPFTWVKKDLKLAVVFCFNRDGTVQCITDITEGFTVDDFMRVETPAVGNYLFLLDDADLNESVPQKIDATPTAIAVVWNGRKFDAGKAAKVTLDKKTGMVGVSQDKPNVLGLTLKYSKGMATGSFTIYSVENKKLVKNKFSLSGLILGNHYFGEATHKKLKPIMLSMDPE